MLTIKDFQSGDIFQSGDHLYAVSNKGDDSPIMARKIAWKSSARDWIFYVNVQRGLERFDTTLHVQRVEICAVGGNPIEGNVGK